MGTPYAASAPQGNDSCGARIVRNDVGAPELSGAQLERMREQVRAGNSAAFNDVCRDLMPRLWRQAIVLSGNPSQAEDLVQETLVEAWRAFPKFRGHCRFFTWVCAILINRYRNAMRGKSPWARAWRGDKDDGGASEQLQQIPDPAVKPDQAADHAERNIRLAQALDLLPHRQRQVVYLRFYAGDSLEGIAAALGCSVGTVKSRLFHGLERLRKMKSVQGEGR